MQEPEVVGHLLVEQAERMGHLHLAQALEAIAVEIAVAGGAELAPAIERHHRAFGERRSEEGARLVREVMLDEMPLPVPLSLRAEESLAHMVRRAVEQLALRVHD